LSPGPLNDEDLDMLAEAAAWAARKAPNTLLHRRIMEFRSRVAGLLGIPLEAPGEPQERCRAAHGTYGRCEYDRSHSSPHGASSPLSFGRDGAMMHWIDVTVEPKEGPTTRTPSSLSYFLDDLKERGPEWRNRS
jgi:hypothetical protein